MYMHMYVRMHMRMHTRCVYLSTACIRGLQGTACPHSVTVTVNISAPVVNLVCAELLLQLEELRPSDIFTLTQLCHPLSTTTPCIHPPQRTTHAHNPDGLSYANADTSDGVEPRRQSKRNSRIATASTEARGRKGTSFRETDEWEFRSTVRDREQEAESQEVHTGVRRRSSRPPTPILSKDVPMISLDDEYHQAMGMDYDLPQGNKPQKRAPGSRSSTDEPHASIEEELEQDANQRGWFSPDNPRSRTPDATNTKKPSTPGQTKPTQVTPPTDFYDVSVRQVAQSVLPPAPNVLLGCPATFAPTNVYAYGPRNIANQPFHNWPGFTIEAQVREDGFLVTHTLFSSQLVDVLA